MSDVVELSNNAYKTRPRSLSPTRHAAARMTSPPRRSRRHGGESKLEDASGARAGMSALSGSISASLCRPSTNVLEAIGLQRHADAVLGPVELKERRRPESFRVECTAASSDSVLPEVEGLQRSTDTTGQIEASLAAAERIQTRSRPYRPWLLCFWNTVGILLCPWLIYSNLSSSVCCICVASSPLIVHPTRSLHLFFAITFTVLLAHPYTNLANTSVVR